MGKVIPITRGALSVIGERPERDADWARRALALQADQDAVNIFIGFEPDTVELAISPDEARTLARQLLRLADDAEARRRG